GGPTYPSVDVLARAGRGGQAKTKKWTCRLPGARLESEHHEGLWPVLSDRHGVRDVRRALDAADPPGAAGRGEPLQRDPARHTLDLAHLARPAPARARGRGRHHQPAARPWARTRVPADSRGRGVPRGPGAARPVGSTVGHDAVRSGESRPDAAHVERAAADRLSRAGPPPGGRARWLS